MMPPLHHHQQQKDRRRREKPLKTFNSNVRIIGYPVPYVYCTLGNLALAYSDLDFASPSGRHVLRHYSRTASEPPHEPIPFLKPRLKARSTQPSERGTDMMVADATSEKGGIASSGGRRFAPSRRRRCRCAHFHHAMWRRLVKYSSARVRCAYPCQLQARYTAKTIGFERRCSAYHTLHDQRS